MSIASALGGAADASLLAAVAVLLVLSTVAAIAPRSRANPQALSLSLSALACVGIFGLGVSVIASGTPLLASAGDVLGFALIHVRYDPLGGLFLVVLGVAGAASSVFGIGYTAHGASGDRTAAAYPVFIASLALVFGADDVFAFLFAWEIMALSSAILVVGSRPSADVARAGYLYLALTHLATAALIIAFAILAATAGSTSFGAFGQAAARLPPGARDIVFLLLLLGFGTKAGAIPLHVWLPRAHPVAPSHVSALMSGVMIKAGVYGIVRFGLDLLGPGPEWWGLLVLAIGVASAVLGVLYALMEHDLKRLLAFHSIENIGIILIGVGVAILALGDGATALAAVALTAALFHTLNHALFKSVLFLAAGSIQSAVGSRDLNVLGGLARAMPVTALAFGIGAAAISGLPPLNGFASEWLTFQGLIGAGGDPALSLVARSAVLLTVAGLALTAALAVACFVKATGMSFLALPRSPGAAGARETGRTMGAAMASLAIACIGVGIAAGPVSSVILEVAGELVGSGSHAAATGAVGGIGAVYAAAPLTVLLVAIAGVTWLVGVRRRQTRRTATWTCGIVPEPAFEYTATSYAKLIRLYFGPVLRPVREISVEFHPGTPFARTVRYRGEVSHLIDERLYRPLHRAAIDAAQLVRRLQSGSLQLYLAYAVTALIALLLLAHA
ncbi:MAG: hydrogenase 4 subunit B [Chloroflexi bacterium]|nr:hydrogenase 4 subunit B [Chloroflexota bacterium]